MSSKLVRIGMVFQPRENSTLQQTILNMSTT